MRKSIQQRIDDSFDDSDREQVAKYIDWLQASANDTLQNLRRSAALALLLVAIFEVIAQSPKSPVTIAEFRITRDSVVFTFLPAIVAYLYFQLLVNSVRTDRLTSLIEAAFKKWSAKGGANDLHAWIVQMSPLYWNVGMPTSSEFQGRADRLEDGVSQGIVIAILFGVLAFEGQAYYILFNPELSKNVLWFISVCISFSLLLFASLYAISYFSEL